MNESHNVEGKLDATILYGSSYINYKNRQQ